MSSACECFAGLSGDWRHHVKPTVTVLDLHLEGKKILLVIDRGGSAEEVDLPSRRTSLTFESDSKLSRLEKYALCGTGLFEIVISEIS
jgi:hypothetical protein